MDIPDDVSGSENESDEYDDEDDDDSDKENHGLGIGNEFCIDSLDVSNRDHTQFEFVFEEPEFLGEVSKLMRKIRTLIKTVKNSTNILRFVRQKQKLLGLTFQLIQDFKIRYENGILIVKTSLKFTVLSCINRWNYSYICLSRLLEYYAIVCEVTSTVKNADIPGLLSGQIAKLKSFFLHSHEWQLIQALVEVLAPFYTATKCLSVRTRQTFGDGYLILDQLKNFLETPSSFEDSIESDLEEAATESSWKHELNALKTDEYYKIVNYLKALLLKAFNLYTGRHISKEMNDALKVYFSFKMPPAIEYCYIFF
jgi:hypothetical protein